MALKYLGIHIVNLEGLNVRSLWLNIHFIELSMLYSARLEVDHPKCNFATIS